jgi:thiamine biosynthesis lipoprotein
MLYTSAPIPDLKNIIFNGTAQGTTYHISYFATDTLITKIQVDSVLASIDSSLSLYKPYSVINQFNNSTEGVKTDIHLTKVVKKAIQVFKETGGLFDITVEPLTSAWGFGPEKMYDLPDSAAIKVILPCVNSRLLYWKGSQLRKTKSCVKLDANGIAQGYTVDVLADFFERNGIKNYLIELGGEIRIKGRKQPGGEKMSIGIESPGDDPGFSIIEKVIWLDEGAITTSGNYRRYYESNGKKITHIFNPKTGYPIQNELVSVTVFAKDAITADGYDNALMAMGLKKALAFVNKRKDIAVHFIYHIADGSIADTMSKSFRVLLQP